MKKNKAELQNYKNPKPNGSGLIEKNKTIPQKSDDNSLSSQKDDDKSLSPKKDDDNSLSPKKKNHE